MFARIVRMKLKSDNPHEFARVVEQEVLPVLRRQNGFRDEITFLAPGGKEAVGISLWEEKEQAETYSRNAFQDVMKVVGKVVEGTPQVQTYEVSNSTIHQIAARVAA